MDRGAWQATVHGVAKSQTQLSDFNVNVKAKRQGWPKDEPFISGSDFHLLFSYSTSLSLGDDLDQDDICIAESTNHLKSDIRHTKKALKGKPNDNALNFSRHLSLFLSSYECEKSYYVGREVTTGKFAEAV